MKIQGESEGIFGAPHSHAFKWWNEAFVSIYNKMTDAAQDSHESFPPLSLFVSFQLECMKPCSIKNDIPLTAQRLSGKNDLKGLWEKRQSDTQLTLCKCFMRSVPKEDPTHLWLVYLTALDSCVLHVQSLFIRFMLLFCKPQGSRSGEGRNV